MKTALDWKLIFLKKSYGSQYSSKLVTFCSRNHVESNLQIHNNKIKRDLCFLIELSQATQLSSPESKTLYLTKAFFVSD